MTRAEGRRAASLIEPAIACAVMTGTDRQSRARPGSLRGE